MFGYAGISTRVFAVGRFANLNMNAQNVWVGTHCTMGNSGEQWRAPKGRGYQVKLQQRAPTPVKVLQLSQLIKTYPDREAALKLELGLWEGFD